MGDTDETPPEIDGPPRRTSPLTLVLNFGGAVVFLVVLLPQLLTAQRPTTRGASSQSSPVVLIIVVGIAGLQLLIGGLSWFARTYTISSRELVIDQGILGRQRKVVPFARVQQVDINQPLLAQLMSLATLRIDTAGEGGAAVKLGMIDVKLARGMRSYILGRRAELQGTLRDRPAAAVDATASAPSAVPMGATGVAPAAAGPQVELLRLGPGRLALAGATHHVVVLGIPLLVVAGLWIAAFASLANRTVSTAAILGGATAIALVCGVAFVLLVVLQYVLGLFGFTLAEQGDDLHLRFGLLQVRNLTIPRRRVQHITIVDNPVRRALGIVAIHLHSAAPLGADHQGSTRFEIPILPRQDIDSFLHALMGGDWHVPALTPRSSTAQRRAITRRVALLAVLMIPPAVVALPGSLAVLLVAVLGIPWGLLAHRRAGFAETPEIVVLAHGALRHHVDLLPYSRVQSCRSEQNPMQRLCRLRTLHVNVAGPARDPHLYDMPDREAIDYLHDLPRRSSVAR